LLFAVCFECNEVNIKNSFYLFLKSQEIEKTSRFFYCEYLSSKDISISLLILVGPWGL